MKVVTSYETLMILAKEVGDARKSGDRQRIDNALTEYKSYLNVCLAADRMVISLGGRTSNGGQ